MHESEDLFSLIETYESKPLKLYVYNTAEDTCREVTITPNSTWGGEGSLGCGIGYGYLHRIPVRNLPEPKSRSYNHPHQATSIKVPVAAQVPPPVINSPSVTVSHPPAVTAVPPGFSIPPGYISTTTELINPTTTVNSSAPLSSIEAINPVAAGASTTINSAAHYFPPPPANYPQSKYFNLFISLHYLFIYSLNEFLDYGQIPYQDTPSIPGMPTVAPLQSSNLQQSFEPTSSLPLTTSQAQLVTTPINLPGMPPITVSASLPQSATFYSPIPEQNQLTAASNINLPTSTSAQ